MAGVLRLSDIAELAPAAGRIEEVVPCDLADKAGRRCTGRTACDAIVHLGGVSVERPFEEILEANINGVFHLYEARTPPRRQAHRLRQLQPRDRLLQAGRSTSTPTPRAGPTATTACPSPSARTWRSSTSTATASRRSACASAPRSPSRQPPHDDHLAELSTTSTALIEKSLLHAPAWATPWSTACPTTRDVWWDNSARRAPGLRAAGQLGSVPRQGRGAAARARPTDPNADLPGRRLHRAGPLRRLSARSHGRTDRRRALRHRAKARCGRAAEQALYWVDIPGAPLHRSIAGRRATRRWTGDGDARLHRAARRRRRPGSPAWKAASSASRRRTTARSAPRGSPQVAHAARRHALQRRPLRPPGPLLGRHHADGHGRRHRASGALYRYERRERRCSAPAGRRAHRAQRPRLQPRRPHDVPVGLAPAACSAIWAFDYDTATGTPHEPPRVRRHEPATRPPRRRRGRRRRLLLDLRQRRRPGAPLHARRPARPLAARCR